MLWSITIILTIIFIIGCVCCEHKDDRVITTINKNTTNKTIEPIVITEPTKKIESAQEENPIKEENTITIEIETNKEVDTNQAIEPVSLGEFKLTAYCPCEKCCGKWAFNRPIDEDGKEIVYGSIGERLQSGYSIAVDPSVIAYGTEVIINGHTYKAQDCGGAIKGNRIDVYFDSHQDALEFGVQYAEVFVVYK